MFWVLVALCALIGGMVRADVPAPDVARITAALPKAVLKQIQTGAERYVSDAAGVIYGYGGDGAIDAAGLENLVAINRAKLCARDLGRMLTADLDGDGAVTGAEATTLGASLSARDRGRLQRAQTAADANGDGAASPDELRAASGAAALAGYSDQDAAADRALLLLDLDGDARVTLDEVLRAVQALQLAAKAG